jgi:O-acetyl-ADP-ribose deacetylase (regulator of RNase III)
MITVTQGNLLEARAEALVNTVNTVGVMGKGIALQFRQAYPDMFRDYEKACKREEVQPGKMHIFERNTFENPKFIINFPTKRHWRGKSSLADIKSGLVALVADVRRLKIRSIAVPPLGCGNGGLSWEVVRPLIADAFASLPEVEVQVFAPAGAPAVDEIKVATERPLITRGRALVILLLERYFMPGYRVSLLEIQKLVYFLQEAGEPLRLEYSRNKYGPYAENLNHVLQKIEGHYTRGYGDRSAKARSEIMLLPGAVEAARTFLSNDPGATRHLDQVAALIAGFENPYGMELLATVHWVAKEFPEVADNSRLAVAKVKAWSTRKSELFKDSDIESAWQRLRSQGWFKTNSLLN